MFTNLEQIKVCNEQIHTYRVIADFLVIWIGYFGINLLRIGFSTF